MHLINLVQLILSMYKKQLQGLQLEQTAGITESLQSKHPCTG